MARTYLIKNKTRNYERQIRIIMEPKNESNKTSVNHCPEAKQKVE